MDAASRTGVGDVREIIDAVRYRAASARYKVYIIDEVHMLSTSAFNALLKTLEEPPEHVKFIFATTEIRKVPVTVLSRCQRFDLRRIEPETMIAHLAGIAEKEGAEVSRDALALIARAAEGSARDALSLLDQAVAHGGGGADAEAVRAMLGLADRARVLDLFESVMKGDAAGALAELSEQYAAGADPQAVLRDLAEVTHWISIAKVTPEAADDPTAGPEARARARDYAERLGLRALTRAWQMLLKAMEEAAAAPNPMMAAEMAIIRLTHVADLPSPEELIRKLEGESPAPPPGPGPGRAPTPPGGGGASAWAGPAAGAAAPEGAPRAAAQGGARAEAARPALAAAQAGPAPARAAEPLPEAVAALARFEDVVALIRERRDAKLLVEVESGVRLVAYQPGRISFEPAPGAPPGLAADLARRLQDWTGARWMISVESEGGAPAIAEAREAEREDLHAELRRHPLVAAALEAWPQAEIVAARDPAGAPDPAAAEDAAAYDDPGPDDDPDDWEGWEPIDPFEN
jgi:DNA polymerase-3 subunit gamma/tau